ncbi:hypothetical protein Tco_1083313, partial [Tanacetum coccineum]
MIVRERTGRKEERMLVNLLLDHQGKTNLHGSCSRRHSCCDNHEAQVHGYNVRSVDIIGRIIVGIKSLLEVTAAQVRVTAAKQTLVLLSNLNEKYAKYTARVKLVLLVKVEENILSSYYCLYTVNVA